MDKQQLPSTESNQIKPTNPTNPNKVNLIKVHIMELRSIDRPYYTGITPTIRIKQNIVGHQSALD